MKITKFDKQTVKNLRKQFEEDLQQLGEKYGLKLTVGNASYQDSSVDFKVNLAIIREDGVVMTKEREDFQTYAHWYNLQPSDLDRTVTLAEGSFKLIGLLPRRKLPVLMESVSGERKLYNAKVICEALKDVV